MGDEGGCGQRLFVCLPFIQQIFTWLALFIVIFLEEYMLDGLNG